MRKVLLAVMVAALAAGAASAQVTISGGVAASYCSVTIDGMDATGLEGDIGLGGNVYIDYLLPISLPMSLGVEAGVDTSTIKGTGDYEIKGIAIPLLLRAAYHFDISPQLDLYLVGKIGYVLGSAEMTGGDSENGYNGIGFGFDLGVAYYFTSNVGIFAEGGFDQYNAEKKFTDPNFTVKIPFSRFLTAGISVKF